MFGETPGANLAGFKALLDETATNTVTGTGITVTASVKGDIDDLITLNSDTGDQLTIEVTGAPDSVDDYKTLAGKTGKNDGITGSLTASKGDLIRFDLGDRKDSKVAITVSGDGYTGDQIGLLILSPLRPLALLLVRCLEQ